MISIIIPTYNEEKQIGPLISYLNRHRGDTVEEIIVCDGGSTDMTPAIAGEEGAKVLTSPKKGRAVQMNCGAAEAKGNILYFLHADTFPPIDFASEILNAIDTNHECGCFRLSFDNAHWFLKLNSWFTRFNLSLIRFGDQSLFMTRDLFEKSGGFNEKMLLLEDLEIFYRLRKFSRFRVVHDEVTTSARKYIENGIYRLQGTFFYLYMLYWFGYSQETLLRKYRSMILQDKV